VLGCATAPSPLRTTTTIIHSGVNFFINYSPYI
jgi:hypothetical protein